MLRHLKSNEHASSDNRVDSQLTRADRNQRHKAVILLIVVGMLSMLFITLTAFIQIARFDRETLELAVGGENTDLIQDKVTDLIADNLAQTILSDGSLTDIPGAPGNEWLASPSPIRASEAVPAKQRYAVHSNPIDNDRAWKVTSTGIKSNRSLFIDVSRIEVFDPLFSSHYPRISTFGGASTVANSGLGTAPIEVLRNSGQLDTDDEQLNGDDLRAMSRIASADADGDGIPDTSILANFGLTRQVHEMLGKSVSPPPSEQRDFEYEQKISNDARARIQTQWDRYLENTQYEVAARIVSNGGHLQLDMGYEYSPMRDFIRGMAGWLFDDTPGDTSSENVVFDSVFGYTPDEVWFELAYAPESIERSMRRRGGLRPPAGVLADDPRPSQLPEAVRLIDQELYSIFDSRLYALDLGTTSPQNFEDYSQRFNLADVSQDTGANSLNDTLVWGASSYLSPDDYNSYVYDNDLSARRMVYDFGRRTLLGAMNYSSDVARQMESDTAALPDSSNPRQGMGLFDGQLKFFLGHVDRAFELNDSNFGRFKTPNNDPNGVMVIRTLADYYYEMLGGHAGWNNDAGSSGASSGVSEAVSREDQAYMLAVNTVAAAAPYDYINSSPNDGVIYTPYITRTIQPGNLKRRYYGAVPQLYITQVMTHTAVPEIDPNKVALDPNDPNTISSVDPNNADTFNFTEPPLTAVAVELYNPHDRELALKQYAIQLSGLHGQTFLASLTDLPTAPLRFTLPPDTRIAPRSFVTFSFSVEDPNSGLINNELSSGWGQQSQYLLPLMYSQATGSGSMTVRLMRSTGSDTEATDSELYAVDQMKIGTPRPNPVKNTADLPTRSSRISWMTVYRDTSDEIAGNMALEVIGPPLQWFDNLLSPTRPARWRMATPILINDAKLDIDKGESRFDGGVGYFLGAEGILSTGKVTMQAPEPPLQADRQPATVYYTQNPEDPTQRPEINGVRRPAAYPTVGFLAFVPRFAHYTNNPDSTPGYKPMTKVLEKQLEIRSDSEFIGERYETKVSPKYYSSAVRINNIPVDFGHMPFFDNQQPVKSDGPLKDNALPWGMLVFDYFTTHDPEATYRDPTYRDPTDDRYLKVDPYRIPGRININAASWLTLAGLPVIDPAQAGLSDSGAEAGLSPAFWDEDHGVLVAKATSSRSETVNPDYRRTLIGPVGVATIAENELTTLPKFNGSATVRRLGTDLAQAIEAHRERIQTFSEDVLGSTVTPLNPYVGASQRDPDRDPNQISGPIRTEPGFFTLGELLNVRGFDSSEFNNQEAGVDGNRVRVTSSPDEREIDPVLAGDYYRAISLLALLDTHFITTQSNTYTAYVSIFDKFEPENSARMQMTLDRSYMTKRLQHDPLVGTVFDPGTFNKTEHSFNRATVLKLRDAERRPRVLSEQRIGYYNTRFDQ
jgi:hypothetical protein